MTSFYKLTTIQTFLLSLFVTVFSVANMNGQTPVANLTCGYAFSTNGASWSSILGGTGTNVIASGTTIDDQVYMNNIFDNGFSFDFNGTIYTSFNISANGYLFFGNTNPGVITNPISNPTTAFEGVISGLGANLQAHTNTSNTPQIMVQTSGTAPNRVCTIEWSGFKAQGNAPGFLCAFISPVNANRYDFQIKLYENGGSNSNVIDIIEHDQYPYCIGSNTLSAQVGLRGASNTDYRNRSASGITSNTSTAEGTSNSAVISHVGDFYFNGDVRLRYTPKIQPATIAASQEICVGEGGTTLTESANNATTGATYQWYSSPANTPISGAVNSTYAINPALGSHSYYVRVSNPDGCVRVSAPYTVNVINCGSTISVTATAGAGGTISPSGTTNYNAGDTPTYTITPNCGYEITSILVNGSPVTIANTYTFAALAASATISVTFTLKAEVCNGIDDDCDGTIDNVPNLLQCQVCQNGSLQTLPTVTWYQDSDGDSYGNPAVTLSSCTQPTGYVSNNTDCDDTDAEITNLCLIIITSSAGSGGTISPNGETSVDEGGSQQYTITPNCGYEIAGVLVNGGSVGTVSTYTFTNVTSNQTISVTFSLKAEVCNGIDDDCDGNIDNVPNLAECQQCIEGELITSNSTTWYADADNDGHGDINNSISDCIQPPGYVSSNNDCNDADSGVWLAKPAEIVMSLSPNLVCSTASPFQLGTVVPSTGTWGGSGVTAGVFNPAVAGIGPHTLTYHVQGDGACVLSASASATMTVQTCQSVDETGLESIFIYPTQTSGRFTINGIGINSASIIDMNGRLIETISLLGQNTIDISTYSNGIYLVRIEAYTGSVVQKVIKVD